VVLAWRAGEPARRPTALHALTADVPRLNARAHTTRYPQHTDAHTDAHTDTAAPILTAHAPAKAHGTAPHRTPLARHVTAGRAHTHTHTHTHTRGKRPGTSRLRPTRASGGRRASTNGGDAL
jgi:hypothetical protein